MNPTRMGLALIALFAFAGLAHSVALHAQQPGAGVVVAVGWNLIAAPNGTVITGNSGPLYTFQAGDTAYETIAAGTSLHGGQGYWAYFPAATTLPLPADSTTGITLPLPAGQYVMVGNPSSVTATVTGADLVSIYDPTSGYQQRTTLSPGQGAWALSSGGSVLTVAPSSLTVTIPPVSAPSVAVGLPLTLTSPSSTTAPPAASGLPAGCVSYTGGPCVTLCRDGQWSSSSGRGTCSGHGGEQR